MLEHNSQLTLILRYDVISSDIFHSFSSFISADVWTYISIALDYTDGETSIQSYDTQTGAVEVLTNQVQGYYEDSENWWFGLGFDIDAGPTYNDYFVGFMWEFKIFNYARKLVDISAELGSCTG